MLSQESQQLLTLPNITVSMDSRLRGNDVRELTLTGES
jgi:hypothetical protein